MTAAGSFVTNGSLAGTFGAAPLSSLAGAPLSLTDVATGLTNFAPTLASMTTGLAAISGVGAPLAGLGPALSAINGAGFSTNMLSAFNAIPTDLGVGGGLFDAVAGFAPSVNDLLTDVTGGSGVLNDALKYAGDWSADTLGGTFAGIGGDVIGDPKKFGTILSTASSYVTNANQLINAATNVDSLANSFTNLDNVVSGGLSGVNLDFGGFGSEITKLGGTINWSNLEGLGSPGQLLANLDIQGTLGPMYDKIANISVDSNTLSQLGSGLAGTITGNISLGEAGIDLNTIAKLGDSLPAGVQSQVYSALGELDTTEIAQVKSILGNTVDGITSGTDLLDPKKLFPETFQTLTVPVKVASPGFRSIYENDTGSVNPQLEFLGENLQGIVPDDVAVANGALSRSFGQIKNISKTTTSDFGSSVAGLESLKDLDLLENQQSIVTDAVATYWKETYGTDSTYNVSLATGNGGQVTLSDVVGFAAGYNSSAPLTKNAQLLSEMETAGELTPITGTQGVYDTINEFCAGTFGPVEDPPASGTWKVTITAGYLGAGIYTGASSAAVFEDAWVNGIVPAIKTVLASYTSNTKAVEIMTNSERWNQQLAREYLNQSRMDNADLTAVRASDDAAINLATNLPNYGLDTSEGGAGELLERIVDFSSLGGQSVIAAMREGRNIQRLSDANIAQDAPIDTTGLQDPANLLGGQYTQSEAQSRVIKS